MAARVFIGYLNGDASSMVAILPQPGLVPNLFRISRTIVLPDFQGLGLSNIMNEYLGELYYKSKNRLSITTTHPGLIKSYFKSSKWKIKSFDRSVKSDINFDITILSTRLKASFIYIPINFNDIWDIN